MPISPSVRSAKARAAALVRHATAPATMAEAHAGLLAKYEATVAAICPGLLPSELETRALRLRSAWLQLVAVEGGRRKRGEPARAMSLDAWLAERVAIAQTKTAAALHDTAAVQEDDRVSDLAPSSS